MDGREALLRLIESKNSLANRFSAIKRIGKSGGFGNFSLLFSADDREGGERVALKVFNPQYFGDAYRYTSFDREASVLGTLRNQKDIIQIRSGVLDFSETLLSDTGIAVPLPFRFYALELAESDVGALIADGQYDSVDMLDCFHTMCRAVQRLHLCHHVHRDLKPDNFLIVSGQPKLSDFGTSRHLDDGPTLDYSDTPGALLYSAPELRACLHNEAPWVAKKSDFFSLGAILFEFATGTKLGLAFRDPLADLNKYMQHVPRGKRREVYEGILPDLESACQLPTVRAFDTAFPRCVLDRIDALYQSLSRLDYRYRLTDFSRVFGQISICKLILANEASYLARLRRKDKWRRGEVVKRTRSAAQIG